MSPLFYISLFLLVFVAFRFFVALVNYITRPELPFGEVVGSPMVSVLIPARNEEQNIQELIKSLLNQTYTNIEIIVYNDQSTDSTGSIVLDLASTNSQITLIQGHDLPCGWLGKNHACYQLAKSAKGNFFLFLDADVSVSPHLLTNALAFMQRKKLNLLSMFPRQELRSTGEKLVVPSMNWILLTLLILRLIYLSKRRSLSAANGQMMMFDADTYRHNEWHQRVMKSAVEDIAISRMVKKQRLKMATLLGVNDISCRMYGSYHEAITGFTKNVTAFFGGSIIVTLLFALMGTVGPFIALFGLPFPLVLLYFTMLLSSRIFVSKLSKQSLYFNVILWPLQHFAFLHLVYKALVFSYSKKFVWKGRSI